MAEKVKYQSMAELARELKITRQTLYNRAADHNIDYRGPERLRGICIDKK